MIWILTTRGASTKLRASPFTETPIEGVHSIVYKPGVEPIPLTGDDTTAGQLGTFARGIHRVAGVVFSHHGSAAETLLSIAFPIDLIIRYRANQQKRMRTLQDIVFLGDASVTLPGLNMGLPELIGVPFRMQLAEGTTLSDRVIDAQEV